MIRRNLGLLQGPTSIGSPLVRVHGSDGSGVTTVAHSRRLFSCANAMPGANLGLVVASVTLVVATLVAPVVLSVPVVTMVLAMLLMVCCAMTRCTWVWVECTLCLDIITLCVLCEVAYRLGLAATGATALPQLTSIILKSWVLRLLDRDLVLEVVFELV